MKAPIVEDIRTAAPGSIEPRDVPGVTRGLGMTCPGCGDETYIPLNAYGATNGWTIKQEEPMTLSPSLLNRCCGWHGYLRNGELVSV